MENPVLGSFFSTAYAAGHGLAGSKGSNLFFSTAYAAGHQSL